MKTSCNRLAVVAAGAALSLALAGCSFLPKPAPDPTRHYVLTGPSVNEAAAKLNEGRLAIGLRSLSIAPYLDGKAMIVRRGENEIDYRDFARWAEPLAIGVQRMLRYRLEAAAPVKRVYPQPFPFDAARDVDVSVNVLRAEGRVAADGRASISFVCAFEIVRATGKDGGGGEVLAREVFEAPEVPWTDGDYAALAVGVSDAVAKLAEAIAAKLPSD